MYLSRLSVLMLMLGGIVGVAHAQTCPPNNPPPITPDNRYTVSQPLPGHFVVTDVQTGLMWKQCPEGLSGTACESGSLSALNWSGALTEANNSTHAGFDDWRLPNLMELRSLVETSCYNPNINTTRFPATPGSGISAFWSATTAPQAYNAWSVLFGGGIDALNNKINGLRVRLVRGGQPLDTFASEADFTPNAFAFSAQNGVPTSSLRTSNSITVSGITTPVGIAISGAAGSAYSINGGAYTSAPGSVANGDTVTVRHTSAATVGTTVTSTLSIGPSSASFASTTGDTLFNNGFEGP